MAYCENEFNESGAIICCKTTYIFKMNNINLRYLKIYPHGYYNDNIKYKNWGILLKEDSDSPYMEIGKCSPL